MKAKQLLEELMKKSGKSLQEVVEDCQSKGIIFSAKLSKGELKVSKTVAAHVNEDTFLEEYSYGQ